MTYLSIYFAKNNVKMKLDSFRFITFFGIHIHFLLLGIISSFLVSKNDGTNDETIKIEDQQINMT